MSFWFKQAAIRIAMNVGMGVLATSHDLHAHSRREGEGSGGSLKFRNMHLFAMVHNRLTPIPNIDPKQ